MDNIFRGEAILKEDFIKRLPKLTEIIEKDLLLEPLTAETVVNAANILAEEINKKDVVKNLVALGIPEWTSTQYVEVIVNSLKREELLKKVRAELGQNPFGWMEVSNSVKEKNYPLGVLMHIGAGNALGLSAFSVIEGLLSGNINILKLPENEAGLSSKILLRLIEIEPKLKPYIYVIDVSSKNTEIIKKFIEISNAVTVWGSDEAIQAIRQLAPPSLPIIEWGHRLSFAYFTENEHIQRDLEGLALDICLTDQLYCSSPQCVFYETDNINELDTFANSLSICIDHIATKYPSSVRPINVQAQITLTKELLKMEEILGEKRLITDDEKQYSVMIDYNAELKASPLFRNIWVMPIKRHNLLGLLRKHKGHLQTVGLSCKTEAFNEISNIFYASGVNRITTCGHMSENYSGEPHDGVFALSRYVRKVNKRIER